MRHFSKKLLKNGYQVHYTKLDDIDIAGSFKGELKNVVDKYQPDNIVVTFPGEYRVLQDIQTWESELNIKVEIRDYDRFLCTPDECKKWAGDRKNLRMEFFYREMRKKFNVLVSGNTPEGGDWNYDAKNRKTPNENDLIILRPLDFKPDEITKDVIDLVTENFEGHFGDLEPFCFAVTHNDALKVLQTFINERLPNFGDYQDAMLTGQPVLIMLK